MRRAIAIFVGLVMIVAAFATVLVGAATAAKTSSTGSGFTNIVLSRADGGSEPAVSIGPGGTVILGALSWQLFQTNMWTGSFGTTPTFQGAPDANVGGGIGGGDEDIDWGSTGTIHISTLMFFFNPTFNGLQLGVSAITCPKGDTSDNFAHCSKQIIDTTQADRQWIVSDGPTVYISYHDSGSSTLIHVVRSDDDGIHWTKVSSPIPGQGKVTGSSTFNNDQGELQVDPVNQLVYAVWAAGEASVQKGTNANFNNIYVSRSSDKGLTWSSSLVFHAPLNTALNNVFPALAVDPSNGNLYASWSDAHTVWASSSTEHGATWSAGVAVNTGNALTAVFPAIAARSGTIDLAYYGTTASSKDDLSAVWKTYMSTSTDGGATWKQAVVSSHANHVGAICTNGTGCVNPLVTRTLLDLFEIAINAQGKAAVIYTDDTLATFVLNGTTYPLPQVIVGYQR